MVGQLVKEGVQGHHKGGWLAGLAIQEIVKELSPNAP
jgi:hypothetical protein